jgi:sigma-B regulation protein RsbU (phosphoserine phosphatase)
MNRSRASRDRGTVQITATPSRHRAARVRRRELEEKLSRLQSDYADLHVALFEAAQVHRKLCAPRRLRFGSFVIASEIFAVRQLPGDFFIAQQTPRGVMFSLGDVCGKGLAAGMWVTHLAALIATHTAQQPEPQAIAVEINRAFERMPAMPLISLFQGSLDPVSGKLDYCNSGHPPALLLRANGAIEELYDGGSLLGAFRFASFAQGRVQLQPGDALVIYSDGILDSTNPSGEQFGHVRWEENLHQARAGDADVLLLSLLGAVQDFAGGYPIQDDMSLVVLRRDSV